MSTAGPQVKDQVLIKADLGENGGSVAFGSVGEAKEWIDQEIQQWERFANDIHYVNPFSGLMDRQLRLPQEIKTCLERMLRAEMFQPTTEFQEIEELFERYADFDSVCSKSPIGAAILKMRRSGGQSLLGIGGLASILGIPAREALVSKQLDHSHLHLVLSGYALGGSANVVRRSDLPEHKFRMGEQFTRLDGIIEDAGRDKDKLGALLTRSTRDVDEALAGVKTKSDQAIVSAQQEWDTLRAAFEQELQLRAPATYWREQARSAYVASLSSLAAFTLLAGGFIVAVVGFGPWFLEQLTLTGGTTHFGTLALVSLPALTALWVMRHVARLFVTNLERGSDARYRETMTTTFLALTKDGTVEASAEERLLVLEALFRSPAPAPTDDGHWGGLSELLTRRKLPT